MSRSTVSSGLVQRIAKKVKRIIPLALADAVILFSAYALTHGVRTGSIVLHSLGFQFVIFAIILSWAVIYAAGGYHRLWSQTSGHDVVVIITATFFSTFVLLILDLLLTPRPVPLSVVAVSHILALNGYVGVRYRSRLISGLDWRWRAIWYREFPQVKTRVLIVGAGEAGQIAGLRLRHRFLNGHNSFQVVGYVDDDPKKQGLYIQGVPVLASCDEIIEVAQKHHIDLIVFAIHNLSGARFRRLLELCEQTSARIKIIPNVFEILTDNVNAPMLRDVEPQDLLGRQPIEWHQQVDASPVTGKVVLVTGAAGSIGSELCRQMMNYQPVHLIMLDNNESGLHDLLTALKSEFPNHTITGVLADITRRESIEAVFTRYTPQLVFHAAAYKHVPLLENFPEEAIRVNIQGTLNVAEIAQAHRTERFLLISTDKAVNPSSVMGASKRLCELVIQALASQENNATIFAAVRFGNVLGSRGSVVPTFTRQIDAGGPVTVTDEKMVRYFMSIPEAVNLVIHATCLTDGNDLFMLRMGEQVPIIELAERMIRLRGLRPRIDIPIRITGVRPGEKLFEELHTSYEHTHDTLHPDIVRLNGTRCDWSNGGFLNQVRYLAAHGLSADDDKAVLQQLTALAQSVICDDEAVPCEAS